MSHPCPGNCASSTRAPSTTSWTAGTAANPSSRLISTASISFTPLEKPSRPGSERASWSHVSNLLSAARKVECKKRGPLYDSPFERKKTYENLQKNVSVCGFGFAGVWASFRCHTYQYNHRHKLQPPEHDHHSRRHHRLGKRCIPQRHGQLGTGALLRQYDFWRFRRIVFGDIQCPGHL